MERLHTRGISVTADRTLPAAVVEREGDSERGRGDFRSRLQAVDELLLEETSSIPTVALPGQIDPGGENLAALVACVDLRGILQRPDEEAGRDQQNECESDFGDNEGAAESRAASPAVGHAGPLERLHEGQA